MERRRKEEENEFDTHTVQHSKKKNPATLESGISVSNL